MLGTAYWRLWTSSALSNLADGVLKVALPLVAVQTTRSPVLIAGIAVAFSLPWLVVALPRARSSTGSTGGCSCSSRTSSAPGCSARSRWSSRSARATSGCST
ncbi:hypothetical protein ACFQV2_10880 [Actinokineospora soli]|uniref:Uncharacterized protein n=1 Tax=Actinokineospora soli TaxID=1048753 RepID=A0ABW2TJS6_9PSEU